MQPVRVQINGTVRETMVEPYESLLRVLRDTFGLTGTKEGCSTGYCGACTVLVDGAPVNACLYFAVDADHKDVMTVEGLESPDGALHPLQAAFVRHGGLQCGYCTPGMLVSALALLEGEQAPADAAVRSALSGNLCRCTGYQAIVAAVLDAAETAHPQRSAPRRRARSRA